MTDLSLDALERIRTMTADRVSATMVGVHSIADEAIRAAAKSPSPRPAGEEVAESEIPEILAKACRGEALSPPEQAAHTGYEIGWRDGRNDALSRPAGEEVAGLVAEAQKNLMSYLFGACQPNRGDVFAWVDDHSKEIVELILAKALSTLSADAMEGALVDRIAIEVMRWGTPHFKHLVSTNMLKEAIEAALQHKGETDEEG